MSPSAGTKYQVFDGSSPCLSMHQAMGAVNGRTLKPFAVRACCCVGLRQRNTSITICSVVPRDHQAAIAGDGCGAHSPQLFNTCKALGCCLLPRLFKGPP